MIKRFGKRFDIGTLILTYTCPLSCKMCFFGSNPYRKEKLDERIARQFIDDIAKLGMRHVGFAGGEPTLRLNLLCELIRQAKSNGQKPIVISSGYWGKSEKQARDVTGRLRRAGLDWIQLSLDDDHLEFLSIEDLARALKACREAGFDDIKVIGTSKGNSRNFADLVFYVEQVLGVSAEGIDLRDRYRVSHGDFFSEQDTHSIDSLEQNIAPPACMTELMVDVNADVYPCCQNFIGRIGNLTSERIADVLERADKQEIVRYIAQHGPLNLARKLDAELGTSHCKKNYGSWCEVCSSIFGKGEHQDLLLRPIKDFSEIAALKRIQGKSSYVATIQ